MAGIDTPKPDELPRFVETLVEALRHTLRKAPLNDPARDINLERFTWQSVFERVETVWKELL